MKVFSQWLCAMAAFVLLAGPAVASDAIAAGKIKGVNAEKKQFVLTDRDGKDWTIKLGDTVVINRGGKESQSDLNAGDRVNVCYDKGFLTWTAHYILVQEGDTKDCELVHGTVKNYDVAKKRVTFTDHQNKDWTFPMGHAKVRLNREDSKIEDIKIGDRALAIVEKMGEGTTLKCLMIERK
jgi:Cu/Ag efflux protein CusF